MDCAHLDELITIEQTYWWHIAKQELLLKVLQRFCPAPARVVEGGVGGGNNLLTLRRLGYEVSGLDIMPEAIEHCRQLGLSDVYVHDLQQPWPQAGGGFDAAIMLDVVEHCDDAPAVLRHASDTLNNTGKVIVTVPAIPFLMGPWDQALGHKRRYTHNSLAEHAQQAGLRLTWWSYWNSFSLPPALVVRTFERFFVSERDTKFPRVPPLVNKTFIMLSAAERAVLDKAPLPLGLSLIGVLSRE
jgi:SAM-dependent methyltransferase